MPSLSIPKGQTDIDETVLYLATGAALGAALLAVGWASGSARAGVLGGAFAIIGVWTSWRTRHWSLGPRSLIGILGAILAAGALHLLIRWEMQQSIGTLYLASGDVGLSLALRMAVLLTALSFLLIRRDMLPFALVPAVTLFGLAGARGIGSIVLGCFFIFLPATLLALGQAMLLSGMPARWRSLGTSPDLSSWRRRHWSLLGTLVAGSLLIGGLIYIPALALGSQFHLPLAMMSIGGNPPGFRQERLSEGTRRVYPVGRGPIAPGETPVFSSTGDPVTLWRGEVFDTYAGNAWHSSDAAPTPVRIGRGEIDLEPLFPPTSRSAFATHEVRVEQDMPLVLYGAGQIERASIPLHIAAFIPQGVLVDKFGCVSAPGATLPAGAHYQVISDESAFVAGARRAALSTAQGAARSSATPVHPEPSRRERGDPPAADRVGGPGGADSPSANRFAAPPATSLGDTVSGRQTLAAESDETYMGIPLSSHRVADLARRLTANATSTNDKVQTLVSYLQHECVYTLAAPAVARGEDAADFFLFTSKRGYCDLFATAFAIMARGAGIPSRFVIGYVGGEYDAEADRYVARESDAHAWVEIYEPPYGWVAVDATPGAGPVTLSPLQQLIANLQLFLRSYSLIDLGLGLIVAAALLAGIAFLVLRRTRRSRLALDLNDPRSIVVGAYARLTRALARRGRPRYPNQTPLEYLTAISVRPELAPARRSHSLPEAVLPPTRALTDLFIVARYSPHPITPDTASLALAQLTEATEALRNRRRRA